MLVGDAKREYQRKWVARRRNEWIESRGGACERCGSTDELEVDHIDPATKAMEPAAIWSRRAEVRELELAKCQVLCADCHREKSRIAYIEALPSDHGQSRHYDRGCRCTKCRAANVERVLNQRSRAVA